MSPSSELTVSSQPGHRSSSQAWYRPMFSPEHGVYVVLLVSFLTGAAAAQHWTWETTSALICAFCGFQAEHPWTLQINQRKSLKLRFWIWGGIYSIVAIMIAIGSIALLETGGAVLFLSIVALSLLPAHL